METIRFTSEDTPLDSFKHQFWPSGTTKVVEFYPNELIPVTVLDLADAQQIEKSLNELIDTHPISIDLEWKPDEKKIITPISLFQFCSSKGVLIILNSQNSFENPNNGTQNEGKQGFEILKSFLNSNQFYGKGLSYDQFKLNRMFGQTFSIEDIEVSRIKPHDFTSTFSDLVEQVVGPSTAQFKDKTVSCSDWQIRPLTVQQILYAAFDAYAIRRCWLQFLTMFNEQEIINTPVVVKKKHIGNSKNPIEKISFTIASSQEVKTKKDGKGRGAPQMKKLFKPKILFDVPFGTANDYLYLIQQEENETFGFGFDKIEHDVNYVIETGELPNGYSPRDSINRRLFCLQEVVQTDESTFFCKLCNSSIHKDSIEHHIWMNHCDQIPSYYFPDQSPRYQQLCLQEILVSSLNFKYITPPQENNTTETNPTENIITDGNNDLPQTKDNDVECLICHRIFNSFRSFYTHCKLIHANLSVSAPISDIKHVLYMYMTKTCLFNPENHFCSLCSKYISNEDQNPEFDLNHCWQYHGEIIPNLLKHKPINYSDKCFIESFPLGVKSINQLHVGMMFKGSIVCGFCKIGFDHPGELFVHLFHRHTQLIAVHANEMDQWPLKIYDMHIEFQNVLKRLCFENALETIANPALNIFAKVEEEVPITENEIKISEEKQESNEPLSKSKKKKLLKDKKPEKYIWREKLKKKVNPTSYRCQECNTQCFDDDEDAWQHLIHHHIIPVFNYIDIK